MPVVFGVETTVTTPVSAQRLCTWPRADVTIPIERVDIGHAVSKTAAPSDSVRFSYREKNFVDDFIVLDLDDKFDMVLDMPWLARHDPVIDWAKRTIVRFRSSGATESVDPVGEAHAPCGTCDPPVEAARGVAASDLSARDLRESSEKRVSRIRNLRSNRF
ncbi:unnamed protein product [Phytophthora fragariaefolia]|uniref:Unnamed protein product n=1 Tax=Phytophthora fragariaefolia TaxID=1490495 RepID=A0A9W6YMT7_9STRA|nr:unnamed protein product [Phytophthora fragariaefolia]